MREPKLGHELGVMYMPILWLSKADKRAAAETLKFALRQCG